MRTSTVFDMSKLIRIVRSPLTPAFEVVEDIVIQIHAPYSDENVTVHVSPNIQDYQEGVDTEYIQVRRVVLTTKTDQTQELSFDFANNRKHSVNIESCTYEIELMNIGRETIQDKNYPFFEFIVSKH